MPICPCDLVKKVSPTGDEPLNFGHVRKLYDLGAPRECYEYVFKNFEGKTMKDLFPECYYTISPPLPTPPTPPEKKIPLEYLALGAGIAILAIGLIFMEMRR